MQEHLVVNHGDVDNRERSEETSNNRLQNSREQSQLQIRYCSQSTYPEQDLVGPQVLHPLSVRGVGLGVHPEHAPSHINHLPSKEETLPAEHGEARRASTEHGFAPFASVVATASTEITVSEAVDHEDEGGESDGAHDATDDNHVEDHLYRTESGQLESQ